MNQRQLRSVISLIVVVVAAIFGFFQNQKKGGSIGGGGTSCQDEFRAGQPGSTTTGVKLLCRNEYISLYDPARKVPLLVAEHLTTQELKGSVARTDNFQPDPELASGQRAELSDYRASGYDRGHMAPAADFVAGQTQMEQSFYLSNMIPQNPEMNRGIWAGLEGATRACTKSLGELYVLTGPVFEGRARTIGPDAVAVPSSLYKIVVSGSEARAFVLPNRALTKTSNFTQYETSVDAVQTATGLTFFPAGGVNTAQDGRFCSGNYGG
ncbi:DNA/RNA non-specific endonuclease [Deinococcus radiomollis]|uniref:DNA/RNA non-specific endonuclease n=1 Tax=Deinococcus radiomollis TaxID=468916 RepID=UPI003891B7D4